MDSQLSINMIACGDKTRSHFFETLNKWLRSEGSHFVQAFYKRLISHFVVLYFLVIFLTSIYFGCAHYLLVEIFPIQMDLAIFICVIVNLKVHSITISSYFGTKLHLGFTIFWWHIDISNRYSTRVTERREMAKYI